MIAGRLEDPAGRCAHHPTARDVVAIRLPCCAPYWACRACHDEDPQTDHGAATWPRHRFHESAVMCGACGHTLTIHAYLGTDGTEPACPHCQAPWNPGCRVHWDRYFKLSGT